MTTFRAKLQTALATIAVLSVHAACSSTTTDAPSGTSDGGQSPSATCGDSRRTGSTSCGTVGLVCAAGSHCLTSIPAGCPTGCESDVNCGPSERCVKCGTAEIGSCRACGDAPAAACGATPDAGPAACERNTFFDTDCVSPGKAFECPTTTEPTGQGTCAQTDLAGVWCCGGAVATCKRDTTVDQSECGHPGPTGPRPPKGYTCDSGSEPPDPKCVQGDLPIHWCCPS